MNRRERISHREVIYSEAFNIYVDRVTGKRNPSHLQQSIERVKYRKHKLDER